MISNVQLACYSLSATLETISQQHHQGKAINLPEEDHSHVTALIWLG